MQPLLSRLSREPWAVVSAERSSLGAAANALRTDALYAELRDRGFVPFATLYSVRGVYDGTAERSFLLFGAEAIPVACAIGRDFGQESVLEPAGLRFLSGDELVPSDGIAPGTDPENCSVVDDVTGPVAFVSLLDFAQRVAA